MQQNRFKNVRVLWLTASIPKATMYGGFLLAFALVATYAIAQGDKKEDEKKAVGDKPPAYQVPLLDGKKDRTKAQPTEEYKLAPAPNARELFDMVMACWPERSWFRGELSAEARTTRRNNALSGTNTTTLDPISGNYVTQNSTGNDATVGLLLRVPLWSATELDKERQREADRRSTIADKIGIFVSSLAEFQLTERQMHIHRALEKRAQERVQLGIAETSEQVKGLQTVSELEGKQIMNRANLIKARITLQGLCTNEKAWLIDEYLKRFKDVE